MVTLEMNICTICGDILIQTENGYICRNCGRRVPAVKKEKDK